MLRALLAWLFGSPSPAPVRAPSQPPDEHHGFEALERKAPLSHAVARDARPGMQSTASFLCREAILGRDQRIAGYHFTLSEGTRSHIHAHRRRISHVLAEILANEIIAHHIVTLLGHRLAFLEVPDSLLDSPSLAKLPTKNIVLIIQNFADDGAPSPTALRESVSRHRSLGRRIAIPDPSQAPTFAAIVRDVDFVVLDADAFDPQHTRRLVEHMKQAMPQARLVARGLPAIEDFDFCYKLGATLFQGPFVTSREDWQGKRPGPDVNRLAALLNRLKQDAEIGELVDLLKHDAALSLRLMRYINSAATGLAERVSSIERAMILFGRHKLYRWVMLLIYNVNPTSGRSSAALESALVRARMMELFGEARPPETRDALFLTGMLSLADVVLRVPLDEALRSLGVAPDIVAAVLDRGGPYADLLDLAIATERLDSARVQELAERCGIAPQAVSRCHFEALAWVLDVTA